MKKAKIMMALTALASMLATCGDLFKILLKL